MTDTDGPPLAKEREDIISNAADFEAHNLPLAVVAPGHGVVAAQITGHRLRGDFGRLHETVQG
jgi:hypothetical protein